MNLPHSIVRDPPIPDSIIPLWENFMKGPPSQYGDIWADLFTTDLFPLQRANELQRIIALARYFRPKTLMDIGSDKGSTLFHFIYALQPINVIACEIRGTPYARLFEKRFPQTNFLWLSESSLSEQCYLKVRDWLAVGTRHPSSIDMLFIDGDKSYFEQDFDLYQPLMQPNGVAFMHDITDEAPGAAYRRVRSRGYKTFDILDTSEADEMLWREPRNSYEGWLKHWRGQSAGCGAIFLGSMPVIA